MSMQIHARRLLQDGTFALPPAPSLGLLHAIDQKAVSANSSTPTTPVVNGPFGVSPQFSPTMVIILVILLCAFLFMGFFAIYVRRCSNEDEFFEQNNANGGLPDGHDDGARLQGSQGVDPLLVESFPMVSFAVAKKKGCYECVVCLGDFEQGEELKQLPKCKHVFHPACIGSWLESHTTCPLCRRSLVGGDKWSVSWRWGGSSRGRSFSGRNSEGAGSLSRRDGDQALLQRGGSTGSSHTGAAYGSGSMRPSPLIPSPSTPELALSPLPREPWAIHDTTFQSEIVPVAQESIPEDSATGVVETRTTESQRARWRMGRSNSTGHSLRRAAKAKAATAALASVGCMSLGQLSMCRSRSVREVEGEAVPATSVRRTLFGFGGGMADAAAERTPPSTSAAAV
ncbi:hypothetical protein KP509_09G032300 [Ceratopteris richardii]|uniref:RING-type E3 ubiquitin transferase n=1 Tax=Ceratopteris richardii TaxID=49495 RepID=A0A8T2U9C8_CERRI|nr:hypothetical protein KP509_09G032300 [Ceratopteris richardii]KAH7429128.1 hypothetical protein KP509_09G032300 [Ceratopteris richardii]KAH7429129.1 hypothetical protein KP509_09G032300 [Ceratopteris richardii]